MLSVHKNQVMIEHYKELLQVSDTYIQVALDERFVRIEGTNLHVLALENSEILLEGDLKGILFYGEQ